MNLLHQVVYTTAKKNVKRDVKPNRRLDFEDRHPVFCVVCFMVVIVASIVLLAVM